LKRSILFLSNIPTPYQLDFWSEVQKIADVRLMFCNASESNRHWSFSREKNNISIEIFSAEDSILQKMRNLAIIFKAIHDRSTTDIVIGGYSRIEFICASIFAHLHHRPVFFWLERPLVSEQSLIKKSFFKILFYRTSVLAIGTLAQSVYQKYSQNVFNLPYSIKTEEYSNESIKNANDPIVFLFVGQLIDRKNILGLVEQFIEASEDHVVRDKVLLRIIGDGDLRPTVYQRLVDSGLSNWQLIPFQQKDSIISELQKGDVLVIPSKHDGWAVVVNEAVAAGLAVIATKNVGAAHDIVQAHNCGTVVDDVSEISAVIKRYVDSEDILRSHQRNAKACSREYGSEACASKLIRVLVS
jgi:glycosyltransferase involved in cell wall biosynthesis